MPDLTENIGARLRPGTSERIQRVLSDGERPSDFFREAVEALLERREADLAQREREAKLRDIATWIASGSSSRDRLRFG